MSNLIEILKKTSYETGPDSLLQDFYIPALSCAQSYDRSVGYFSSSLLVSACQGISGLIKSGGKMRLIIGSPLDEEEYDALKSSRDVALIAEDLKNRILLLLDGNKGPVVKYRLQLFAWMVAIGSLEIKFAFRKKGIYHKKIGIIRDNDGNKVAFRGSANETLAAMDENKNAEEVTIYPGWKTHIYEEYGQALETEFYNLWEKGNHHDTFTVSMPSKIYQQIAKSTEGCQLPNLDLERQFGLEEYFQLQQDYQAYESAPFIPNQLSGNDFKIRPHQIDSLEKWRANDFKGILKLATGSGKTITAIYGAVKIYKQLNRLALIVSVPYNELAMQWIQNLALFGIRPHKCFDSRESWYEDLKSSIDAFKLGSSNFLAAVVINKTMTSPTFRELIAKIPSQDMMFIGDECHRHGSTANSLSLPNANLRMGLSATPFLDDDDELEDPFPNDNKNRLLEYYGDIVSEYSLEQAIIDGVLTPYEYRICIAPLTDEEQDLYEELSEKIINILNATNNDQDRDTSALTIISSQRSRLLGSAKNKISALKNIISKIPREQKRNSLFYCAEGKAEDGNKNIDQVSKVLEQRGWRTAQFTSMENSLERKDLLESFSLGGIDALVSMKVLDEGIDIPACKSAFIMASSKNPRQYIQRRGRILRKAEGKTLARIYDFVVCPAKGRESSKYSKNLLNGELERIDDFLLLAENKRDVNEYLKNLGIKK
jgi:superfamily II DNA or RNA helicase